MAITVSNTLNGADGAAPDSTSLASTAVAGSVAIADAGTRAAYDTTTLIRSRAMVEVTTGHHRAGGTTGEGAATPRLSANLPGPPWALRFYCWLPGLQAAGNGTDEVRYLADLGDYALVVHESAGGDVRLQMQPTGDLAAGGTTSIQSGTMVGPDQLLRVEVTCDGTDTVCTLYQGDTTTGRTFTWAGLAPTGTQARITAYRYRRGVLLKRGDTDTSTGGLVTPRQQQLETWQPGILPSGVDGIFGQETEAATIDFQTAFGLAPIDGEIGPETGAALDLMVQLKQGTATPPAVRIGWVAVADTASEIGPWQPVSRANTCDGQPSSPVTVAESADHGDPWEVVDEGIDYGSLAYTGRSSIRFAGGLASGTGVAWQGVACADFSVRGYLRRTGSAQDGHVAWAPVVGGCSLTADGGLSWAGLALPAGTVPADTWVRVEFRRERETVHLDVYGDPQSLAASASASGAVGLGEVTQWWFERFGDGAAWWDEPALADTADSLGAVELPAPPPGFTGVGIPMFAGS